MRDRRLYVFLESLKERFTDFLSRFTPSYLFGIFIYLFVVALLTLNIYTAYVKGMENISRLSLEQEKTNILQAENEELQRLVKYYSSMDYKKMYARDNLSMAERGESLYYIERNEEIEIEKLAVNKQERKQDNLYMWRKLLFGM